MTPDPRPLLLSGFLVVADLLVASAEGVDPMLDGLDRDIADEVLGSSRLGSAPPHADPPYISQPPRQLNPFSHNSGAWSGTRGMRWAV